MANQISIKVTFGPQNATIVMKDPVGPNNTWSATPSGVLSESSGTWTQGLQALPVELTGTSSHLVVSFEGLNTFAPQVGQEGNAVHHGEGGSIGDVQSIHWRITAVE